MRGFTRRGFLIGAGASMAGLASGQLPSAWGRSQVLTRRPPLPSPNASGIEHVVVLCMENRSFDHFLGWVRKADGIQAGLTYLDDAGDPHETHHLTDWQGCGF